MTAGLLIKNDFGTVQIDENWKNMQMISKGVINVWAPFTKNNDGTIYNSSATVTVVGVNPVLTFCSTGQVNILYRAHLASGEWQFTLLGLNDMNGQTTEFWVFDEVGFNAMSNAGVMIKNAAGEVVFHSDYAPLRIIDYRQGNSADGNTSETVNYTAGRKYAVLPAINGFYIQNFIVSFLFGRFYTTALGSISSSNQSTLVTVGSILPIPQVFRWSALIIDVTDL